MESVRETVEREIAEHRQKHGDKWGCIFFNNFRGNLPGGYRTRMPAEILGERLHLNEEQASERRRNQTGYEFQEECKSAAIEAGLTPEQIIEAQERYSSQRDLSFFDMLVPVYIILRERGYVHYKDLTA
jgi:hypothetical protein